MNPLLRDFYQHQVWADAEHWRAIEAHPPAAQDDAIRNRLHHIHLVQHFFVWAVGDREVIQLALTKPDDFASLVDLKRYAREYHEEIAGFLDSVTDARLAEGIDMQWFSNFAAVDHRDRSAGAVRDAQPLSPRAERDPAARARRRAAGHGSHRLVLEEEAPSRLGGADVTGLYPAATGTTMALGSGTLLGPYEIVGLAGAGGMGEVYRARDPRLSRDVAIKIAARVVRRRPRSSRAAFEQ